MRDRMLEVHTTLKMIREQLYKRGFIETCTPVIRRDSSTVFPRVRLEESSYLRDSMEMALRYLTSHFPKIFEIGPCFRSEKDLTTNSNEFLMMELYVVDEPLEYLEEFACDVLLTLNPGMKIEMLSVADYIREDLGIDLCIHSDTRLVDALRRLYDVQTGSNYEIVNIYIQEKIEPLSTERCIIFYDYPASTICSARMRKNCKGIIRRFEVFIDGLEIMHAYEDENDINSFKQRCSNYKLFNYEEQLIYDAVAAGNLPAHTAGLGIGIERLCMAISKIRDIQNYRFSRKFTIV